MGQGCGAAGGAVGIEGKEDRDPTISDLINILQAHIGQQKA